MIRRLTSILTGLVVAISMMSFPAFAEEVTPPSQEETQPATVEQQASEQAGDQEMENSWRYSNGELLDEETIIGNMDDATSGMTTMAVSRTSKNAYRKGIDVSHHQEDINWDKVKNSGIDFVIIRCGGGDYGKGVYADRKWVRNVEACERLGIPYGVYFYSYAKDLNAVKAEANFTLKQLSGHHPDYPVYYDLEDSCLNKKNVITYANTYCSMIEAAGYDAGIYANLNWWNNYLNSSSLDKYEKWVAQWSSACTYSKEVGLWQYTSSGTVAGISGRVDMNYDFIKRPETRFDENGVAIDKSGNVLADRWVKIGGKYYYTDSQGMPLTGFQTIGGARYYLGSGAASAGWKKVDDKTYYCQDAKGKIATSPIMTISGCRYSFDSEGVMLANTTIKVGDYKYTILASGKAVLYKAKTKRKVTLRKGPGTKYAKAGKLGRNKAFTAVKTSGKWSQLADGRWIQTKYRKKTVFYPAFVPYKVQTVKSGIYRSGAGAKYSSKGSYNPGVTATVLQRNTAGTWGRIGKNKWIYLPFTTRVVEETQSTGE